MNHPSLLVAAILAASAACCCSFADDRESQKPNSGQQGSTAPAVKELSEVQKEYRRLRILWEKEREQFAPSSNTSDYCSGSHGTAIIALGPAIIPQLIEELRKGDFFFNVPLARITNVDVAIRDFMSEQEKSQLWLRWWAGVDGNKAQPD